MDAIKEQLLQYQHLPLPAVLHLRPPALVLQAVHLKPHLLRLLVARLKPRAVPLVLVLHPLQAVRLRVHKHLLLLAVVQRQ